MSDVASVIRSIISYEELLTPQFLCPVCGVIFCAVVVFCIGVGFRSSSEPKFENAGDGDGVPFIKKKKKTKPVTPVTPTLKKATPSVSTKTSKKREDTAPEKSSQALKFEPKEKDAYEPVVASNNDDWITPVTRKEKKARRRHEMTPEKETETLLHPDGDAVKSRKQPSSPVEPPKRAEPVKAPEPVKTEPPAPQREKKSRAVKADAASKTTELPAVEVKVKPVEKAKPEKEDDTKSKKSAKQKAKPVEVPEELAPTASPANSTRSKKKKGGAAETPAAATGGFPLADFELPSSVVVPPAAAPQRKTPSPPSTDSSFELVDADAVREAIEAEHQEPSKTSGASRRKNKKPTKSSLPAKVEELTPVPEAPKPTPSAASKLEAEKPAETSNINFDELGGSIDDWQDAKPSRKRRRARRDD